MGFEVGIVCGACDWFNLRDEPGCASCGASLALAPTGESRAADSSAQPPALDAGEAEAVVDAPGSSRAESAEAARAAPLVEAAEGIVPAPTPLSIQRAGSSDDEVTSILVTRELAGAWEPTLPATEDPDPEESSEEVVSGFDRTSQWDLESEGSGEEGQQLDELSREAAEQAGIILVKPLVIGPPGGTEEEEHQMEQARHYICKSCYSPIPGGHKFCGKCGAPTNFAEDSTTTQYFGAMQVPGKAKLILIRGEGLDGISYHLNSTEHVAGRQQGAILFPDDTWLSPRHANFFYRENKLFIRDEDSINGVYCRISGPTPVPSGSMFMCGEQLFRVESAEPVVEGPEADGTYFYASPNKPWKFRVVQVLKGGMVGNTVHDDAGQLVIGREDCQMNFPTDPYLDPKHITLKDDGGQVTLTDMGTMNGTFLRVQQEQELLHGDYVFLGKQLLRVEVTP